MARDINYALRDVGHGLLIDRVTSKLHKRTFINRMLFSNNNILLLIVGLPVHVLYFCDIVFVFIFVFLNVLLCF